MPRKKIVAGNWKMNPAPHELEALANDMKSRINTDSVETVLCVPYVYLCKVQEILKDTHIKVGAQNMHQKETGAFTGEISAEMLTAMGVPYVIIGHSERREYFAETDASVNEKARKALQSKLIPIICVGETLAQRESNSTNEVVSTQLNAALNDMTAEDVVKSVIAYEPVWAIGTGRTATKEQAEEVCAFIREQIRTRFGNDAAEAVRVLYGGSVSPDNANELFTMPNIDGGLVGGASLKSTFEKVVHYDR